MSKRIRTFIAVELAAPMRNRLVKLQQELAPAAHDVKWVESENIHLTLKFLGEVDETDLYEVCKTIEKAVRDEAPFEMSIAGVGAFPTARRPRVVWAGVTEGDRALIRIHKVLDQALRGLGYASEDRPFTPHVTLGRIRRTDTSPSLQAAIESQSLWKAGQCTVREVLVMGSQLTPDGPRHHVMSRTQLEGNSSSADHSTD